jgi:hypothetical protein
MSSARFYLGAWRSKSAISDKDAAKQYAALLEGKHVSQSWDAAVYRFLTQLTELYPDIESLPEDEADDSPWACSLEVSGAHVIMALRLDRYSSVFPAIMQLASHHGLVCFDPQNVKVHLPEDLKPNRVAAQAKG